jgi:hypothetical protein
MRSSGDWVTVVTATAHLSPFPACWRTQALQALHAWQRTGGLVGNPAGYLTLERAQG